MYNQYKNYLENINSTNISTSNFKSNKTYQAILEHVTYELGLKYLQLIIDEFNDITYEQIADFVSINDRYGFPKKETFHFKNNQIMCSPTTIRYIYHSLTILDYYKNTGCKNMVEVGCGYGGLCLAINYFSNLKGIKINNYNIVDLPIVCNLIKNYIDVNKTYIYSNIKLHDSDSYGTEILDNELFFISNYCYTEIDPIKNKLYSTILLPKTSNGFIIWQNGGHNGSYAVQDASEITGKTVVNVIEEKPQTDAGYGIYLNYFVYF